MSIRDCSSTVTAHGEVWQDSFDQRHSGLQTEGLYQEQQMIVKVNVLWVRVT